MRLIIITEASAQVEAAIVIAKSRGALVSHFYNIDKAMDSIRQVSADLVMIDVRLDVAALINALNSERIVVPVVACGMENNTKLAVAAIKAGAREYVPLPPDEELIAALFETVTEDSSDLIYKSKSMRDLVILCDKVSATNANILITGESGTGKEVISRHIHNKSKRAQKPMVCLNCAAIPENLLESELFGHEKGAFTGAIARRIGKFEEADGSTLLLDEISEMDLKLQAKLLRAIQERQIDRVGGSKPVAVDIRIIATSNRNLLEEVKKGNFREDLYYRLNVINVAVPALRERKEDISLFTDYFIKKYAKINGVIPLSLAPTAMNALLNYDFKGNVRELENILHRALLVSSGPLINIIDLALPGISFSNLNNNAASVDGDNESARFVAKFPTAAVEPVNLDASGLVGRTMESVERELIMNTLDHCIGNRTKAANILGISIRTLRNKLNQYKM